MSLIAGQGGADVKVLDQIYKLYNIDNRNTKIENKLNLQNNQISKCQNENNSNIKIEIDENKVEKVDINDYIDLSYNDNENNKNGKMHEIGNNDNNCVSIKCCDVPAPSQRTIINDSNSGSGSLSSIFSTSNIDPDAEVNLHDRFVMKNFGSKIPKKTEMISTFKNEDKVVTSTHTFTKNQLSNLSNDKVDDDNDDINMRSRISDKYHPNETQSLHHSMLNFVKIANSMVLENLPKIIKDNKSDLTLKLLSRSKIKIKKKEEKTESELISEYKDEKNKIKSNKNLKFIAGGNCNKNKEEIENLNLIQNFRIISGGDDDNFNKIENISLMTPSFNSNLNSSDTSNCNIHNENISTDTLPYLGKRNRKYSEVWNEEDFIYKSKQENKFNLITDWSSLINNYDDNYDGLYKDWSMHQRSLSINKSKKASKKLNNSKDFMNFEIISPPVPISIVHPGSWGKNRQEQIEKFIDNLKCRKKDQHDKDCENKLNGNGESKISKIENRRNCNHGTKKKNICASKKSYNSDNSNINNINNNNGDNDNNDINNNKNNNDIKNIYQYIHPASVCTKKVNETNVRTNTVDQEYDIDNIDELTLQNEIIYRELQAIQASNYFRLNSLKSNVKISTQLNVVRAKRKLIEEVLTQMYQCNEMKYLSEGCVTYENIPVPIPAPLPPSSSSSSSPMTIRRNVKLNIRTKNKVNEKASNAAPRYQLGACLLQHIPHGEFISRAKIGVR